MLSPVRARKSDKYHCCNSWKSDNLRELIKELIQKRKQTILEATTLQGAIENNPILLTQYWKIECLDSTTIILYFGGTNNIFTDCTAERSVLHPISLTGKSSQGISKTSKSPIAIAKVDMGKTMLV